jgi:hypothetical protein
MRSRSSSWTGKSSALRYKCEANGVGAAGKVFTFGQLYDSLADYVNTRKKQPLSIDEKEADAAA